MSEKAKRFIVRLGYAPSGKVIGEWDSEKTAVTKARAAAKDPANGAAVIFDNSKAMIFATYKSMVTTTKAGKKSRRVVKVQ